MTLTILIIAALLVSIGLGYTFKINIGLFALSFAYIIGAFAMGRIRDTVGVVMLLPGRKFLVPGNYDRWSSAYPHRQDRVG